MKSIKGKNKKKKKFTNEGECLRKGEMLKPNCKCDCREL